MSERLGWGLLAAVLPLGLMFQWLFGNFLYDPLWLWLDTHGFHAARLLPFVLVNVIPAMLVVAGILVMARADLAGAAFSPSLAVPPPPDQDIAGPDGTAPDVPIMEAVMYIMNGGWSESETRWREGQW